MTRLALAAPNETSAAAGRAIAEAGGNAMDAAIAAALVLMVNEVGLVSASAGGFITVQTPEGRAMTVDGWMDMPGRDENLLRERRGTGTWDVRNEYGGGVTITVGPGSVATHGALAGFAEAHARWGSMPWAELFGPAIEVARAGFVLSGASRFYLDYVHDVIFGWDPESHAVLHDDDGHVTRHPLVLPDLAASFEQLAADPRAMQTGDLARSIVADVQERGGLLSMADLAAYAPVVRPSLQARVGDWVLGTNPPPAVGGVCVAAMLRLLDGHGIEDREHLVRVQRRVLGERLRTFDHTDDLERSAAEFLDLVDRDGVAALESGSTAHVSATDTDGLSVALTVSSGYGSGMIAQGTGIWLNNCLGELELNPRGLHGLPAGSRLLSNMAPTVGRHRDGSTLAIGSPGADRITTAIVQVLAGFANSGLTLRDAVSHPRVHVHRAAMPDEDVVVEDQLSMYFGGVGATLHAADGSLDAAADPRRDGATVITS